MKYVFMFLLGMVLGACHSVPVAVSAQDHTEGASSLESKTVALVQMTDEGARAYCSGVWVGERTILSARHCVPVEDIGDTVHYLVHEDVFAKGPAESRDMRPRKATLAAFDDAHDLVLLRVAEPPRFHGVASLHEGEIEQGAFAQAMGHSLGLWYSYSTGVVAAVREKDFHDGVLMVWVQTTTQISPGNSGGGLFDASGALLGVCHGSFTKGQSLNLFVHVQYVRALLGGKS